MRQIGEIRFSQDHLWVRVDEDGRGATIGISDYLQERLGDISSFRLPEEGEELVKDEPFSVVHAQNEREELIAPVSGEVIEVNEELAEVPELANEEPYEEGWLLRLEMLSSAEFDELLTQDEYEDYLKEEEGLEIEEDLESEDLEED